MMPDKSVYLEKAGRRQERFAAARGRISERREKGLWSFLTWSFFFSQVITAEQAAAATATEAAGAGDDTASTSDASAGQRAASILLTLDTVALAENSASATDGTKLGPAQDAAPADFVAFAPSEFTAEAEPGSTEDRPDPQQASAAPAAAMAPTAEPAAAPETHPTPGTDPGAGVPGVGDSPSVETTPLLDPVVAPVADLVGDVTGEVVQALDQVVAPVLGLVGDVTGDVVQALDPVLDQVVAPVLGLVGDVTGEVVQALDPVLDQVATPVAGLVGDVTGELLQALDPVIAPVADILGGPLGSLLGLGSGSGEPIVTTSVVVASSGSIDFEGPPADGSPLDDLFSGSIYSQYNLALQVDSAVAAGTGGVAPDADMSAELEIAAPDTASAGESGGPVSHLHAGLSGLLGDIGLHGLGL